MTLDPNDWRAIVAQFDEMFGVYRTNRRPALTGKNFVTDEVLGYLLIADEPVEISTGMFLDKRLFGVTWGNRPDGSLDERSQACDTLEEVRALLMEQDGFR